MPPLSKNVFSYPFSARRAAYAVPYRSSFIYVTMSLSGAFLNLKSSGIVLSLAIFAAGKLMASLMCHIAYSSGSRRSSSKKVVLAVIPSISVAYVTAVAYDTPVLIDVTDSVSLRSSAAAPPTRPIIACGPIACAPIICCC